MAVPSLSAGMAGQGRGALLLPEVTQTKTKDEMKRTHLDLFSGVGGFALAAHSNNVETVGFCEINEHCAQFLERTYGKPVHRDIKIIDYTHYRGVWIVTGGPPCQPVSVAGKRGGASDDRWLWPQAIRAVEVCQPAWFLFENPPGIKSLGLDGVLADLEARGYEVQCVNIPACAVDSPQRRERIWIMGHRKGEHGSIPIQPGRQGQASAEPGRSVESGIVGHSNMPGLAQWQRESSHDGEECQAVERTTESLVMADGQRSPGDRRPDQPGRGAQRRITAGRDAQDGVVADSNKERCGSALQSRAETATGRVEDCDGIKKPWSDYDWIACHDSKIRRCPTGLYEMADGVSKELLAALGNAIVWPIAARIIGAMIEAEPSCLSE